MKVREFLERHDLSQAKLAEQLGYQSTSSVGGRVRRDEDVPEAWLPRLQELGYDVGGLGLGGSAPLTEQQYRDAEFGPQAPPDAPQAPQVVQIDYASVAGYIEGAYKLSAKMAIEPADPLLAEVIDSHAAQAGQAWAHWIESEPKVAALLQRMMIGTPLGEVIGVHVAIVFSYTLARSTARQIADDRARAEQATADGAAGDTPEDQLA